VVVHTLSDHPRVATTSEVVQVFVLSHIGIAGNPATRGVITGLGAGIGLGMAYAEAEREFARLQK